MIKPVMLEQKDVELIQRVLSYVEHGVQNFDAPFNLAEVQKLQEQLKMELLWWSAGK